MSKIRLAFLIKFKIIHFFNAYFFYVSAFKILLNDLMFRLFSSFISRMKKVAIYHYIYIFH